MMMGQGLNGIPQFSVDAESVLEVLRQRAAEKVDRLDDDSLEVEIDRAMWVVAAHEQREKAVKLEEAMKGTELEKAMQGAVYDASGDPAPSQTSD